MWSISLQHQPTIDAFTVHNAGVKKMYGSCDLSHAPADDPKGLWHCQCNV